MIAIPTLFSQAQRDCCTSYFNLWPLHIYSKHQRDYTLLSQTFANFAEVNDKVSVNYSTVAVSMRSASVHLDK